VLLNKRHMRLFCCGVACKMQHVLTVMAFSSRKEGKPMQVVLKSCSLDFLIILLLKFHKDKEI
jgi:hypothetical protein